jgi:hypothetical protein
LVFIIFSRVCRAASDATFRITVVMRKRSASFAPVSWHGRAHVRRRELGRHLMRELDAADRSDEVDGHVRALADQLDRAVVRH